VNAVETHALTHRYGGLTALAELDLTIPEGTIFGLLGPNGGGKTTLFRVLSTLLPVMSGEVRVLGLDVTREGGAARRLMGVTFQHPSLDKRLTVAENLAHQGRLYGLWGRGLAARIDEVLARLGLSDRRHDKCAALSGGMQRRVEVAKGLLHRPRLLLLDEPSTGLDPGARLDLWTFLQSLRSAGMTIVLTTHLMEEADRCEDLGILDAGRLVARGSPDALKGEAGGEIVSTRVGDPAAFARELHAELGIDAVVVGRDVRVECKSRGEASSRSEGAALVGRIVERFGSRIESIALARPTLEDVFVRRTGRRFFEEAS
jgi:ABC-2 type transport system ATP-binding protein